MDCRVNLIAAARGSTLLIIGIPLSVVAQRSVRRA
jgi:hypothetical protein